MDKGTILITTDANRLKDAGWHDFVCNHPAGSFFQSPAAYDLFSMTRGYEPQILGKLDKETNRIQGVFLTVLQHENTIYKSLTRRSIAWGGPLAINPLDCIELLKEYESRFSNKAIYTQIRNITDQHNRIEDYKASGYRYKPHLTSLVLTGGFTEEDVLNRMSKSRSRQIRKGLEQAEVVEATSEFEFRAFYSILKQLYTTRVKKPLPHISFFDSFRKYTLPAGHGKLLLVKTEDKTIGGILCAIMPGKAIYEWYIAGLDDEHKALHPSVLATWAAIRYAVRNGLHHFDFLGAGSPESTYGVRDFKERFGGETVEYGRFEKIHQPMLMKIGTFGIRMKQWIR